MKMKKYIACGVALSMVGISCMSGAASIKNADVSGYDTKFALEKSFNEAENTNISIDSESADELLDKISDSVKIEEKDVYKEETVFVFANATGSVENMLVNEHLKNKDGAKSLSDVTDLKDIKNLKGYEEFSLEGEKLTWQAEGGDIYYQGTTDKALPVKVKITYYLNDTEISPSELAGKSGRVKIRYDYEDNATIKKVIDGKEEEIKVPFAAITGMMLNYKFKNVTVENGKCIQEGDSNIVIGYSLLGVKESLALKKDELDIPEYFEIAADVEDFSMDMTVTLIANASGLTIGGELDLEELDALIETISGAGTDLADGSSQVSTGADTISQKLNELKAGINTLNTGVSTLSGSTTALSSGVSAINSSAQTINSGIASLDKALNTAMTDAEKKKVKASAESAVSAMFDENSDAYKKIYSSATTSFTDTITSEATVQAIYSGLYDNLYTTLYQAATAQTMAAYKVTELTPEMQAAVKAQVENKLMELAKGIASGIAENGKDAVGKSVVGACEQSAKEAAGTSAVAGAEGAKAEIAAKIEAVSESGYSLVTGASALAAGTSALNDSMPALEEGIASLSSGAEALLSGSSQLAEGAATLATGAATLKAGIETLNSDVINAIVTAYDGNVKAFADRMTAIAEAATEYDTFTMLEEGKTGTTKFIIRVEGIYAEEEK